jgi:hypothetical protein
MAERRLRQTRSRMKSGSASTSTCRSAIPARRSRGPKTRLRWYPASIGGLRLKLGLCHAQIGEGNLIALCRACLPWIGEIQVADVPGRMEPGTGEINYRASLVR